MDRIVQAEAAGVGLLIVVAAIFVAVELWRNRDTVVKVAKVAEGVGEISQAVVKETVDIVEPPVVIIGELVSGDSVSNVRLDYADMEGGPGSSQWLQLFGADVYNDGFASVHFRELEENAEFLAKKLGPPGPYISGLDPINRALFTRTSSGGNGRTRISPFQIRQNLDSLPISKYLNGLFGSSATTLKNSVWTDWDRLPLWISQWSSLGESQRDKITHMVTEDKALLTAMANTGNRNVWIVRDRVMSTNELLIARNLSL
jgi:hypothetical protein